MMLHRFTTSITDIPLPERFTYPFCYTPHPLCILAAKEVQSYLTRQTAWKDELRQGKMFGVLIVQTEHGETGYLAAFSGILAGKNLHPFFVPPVYDLLQPQGFFKIEEENISSINRNIRQLENDKAYAALSAELARTIQSAENILATAKAQLKEAKTAREQRRKEKELNAQEEAELIRESQFQKAEYKRLERSWKARITTLQTQTEDWERRISALKSERKTRSAALQQKLFEQFGMLNYRGEVKNLCEIFGQTVHKTPPAGAGECAAPKLLQQAYLHGWKPIAMAEFWWGDSPKTEIRHHGHYYPACKGKCEPILQHMLQGLQVEENPMLKRMCVELMEADPTKLVHRNSFNIASMSFTPEIIYAEIKKRLPDFTMDYDVDPVKKAIAESWPNSLDDTCAREEWGWKPEWDLSSMTDDMLEVIRKKNLK